MADLRYSAEIDVRNAQRSLDSLKQAVFDVGAAIAGAFTIAQISTVAGDFENLRKTLQILYKDTAIGAQAFEEIKKFAEESVFSVQDLTETVVKLKTAGIQPTVSLLRLFADTSSVAADSVGALQAITDLYARTTAGGLGLEDLNRLADRGIPVFQILADKLGLSRLEISKIGQTADGAQLILRALESGLNDAFGGASQQRIGTVNQSFSALKDSINNAFDAIGQAGLNEGLSELAKAITKVVSDSGPAFKNFGKVLGEILKFLADNIKIVIFLFGTLITLLTGGAIARAVMAIGSLVVPILKLSRPLQFLIGVLAGFLPAKLVNFFKATDDTKQSLDDLAKSDGFKVFQEGKLADGTENFKAQLAALNQELNKFKAEMSGVANEFARYNQNTIKQIGLDADLISQSKLVQDVERARSDLYRRSQDEIAKLRLAKSKLTEEEKKQGRAGIIDATIAAIQKQTKEDERGIIAAVSRRNQEEIANNVVLSGRQRIYDLTKQLNDMKFEGATMGMTNLGKQLNSIGKSAKDWADTTIQGLANAQNISVEAFKQLYPEQVAKVYKAASEGLAELTAQAKLNNAEAERLNSNSVYVDRQISLNQQLADLYDEQAKMGLSGIEQKYFDISIASRKFFDAQVQAVNKTRFTVDELRAGYSILNETLGGDPAKVREIYDEAIKGTEELRVVTEQNYKMSRTFSAGFSKAFREYVENVSNAAQIAANLFNKGIKGMEDTLVNFVKTGKFEWRGFVAMMLEELLRAQIQQVFANMVGSMNNSMRNVGTGGGGGGGILDFATNALSSLFAGGFANGGKIPAGQFGIVGERGPEFISGPANITPMSNEPAIQNVTYNINAVDAMSFKALVASDPAFIHAVATQGSRSIPGRR